jgi:hypothetical protein
VFPLVDFLTLFVMRSLMVLVIELNAMSYWANFVTLLLLNYTELLLARVPLSCARWAFAN